MKIKNKNLENIVFWIVALIFIFVILYLFVSGRAFK